MGLKPGNVTSADLQQLCSFQLGERRLAGHAVAQQNQLPLPGRQPLNELAQAGSGPIRTGWTGIRNSGLTLPASFSILGDAHSEGKPFTRNGKLDKVAG